VELDLTRCVLRNIDNICRRFVFKSVSWLKSRKLLRAKLSWTWQQFAEGRISVYLTSRNVSVYRTIYKHDHRWSAVRNVVVIISSSSVIGFMLLVWRLAFSLIDIIWAVVIVWRIRAWKITRTVYSAELFTVPNCLQCWTVHSAALFTVLYCAQQLCHKHTHTS